jgi:hypothetical protein
MSCETGIKASTPAGQILLEGLYARGFSLARVAIVNNCMVDKKLTVISTAELAELRDKLTLLQLEQNYLGNR